MRTTLYIGVIDEMNILQIRSWVSTYRYAGSLAPQTIPTISSPSKKARVFHLLHSPLNESYIQTYIYKEEVGQIDAPHLIIRIFRANRLQDLGPTFQLRTLLFALVRLLSQTHMTSFFNVSFLGKSAVYLKQIGVISYKST